MCAAVHHPIWRSVDLSPGLAGFGPIPAARNTRRDRLIWVDCRPSPNSWRTANDAPIPDLSALVPEREVRPFSATQPSCPGMPLLHANGPSSEQPRRKRQQGAGRPCSRRATPGQIGRVGDRAAQIHGRLGGKLGFCKNGVCYVVMQDPNAAGSDVKL